MIQPSHLDQFRDEGYTVVEGVLDDEQDIQPVVAEYEQLLDRLCRLWHAEGRLASAYADLPFGPRFIQAFRELDNACFNHLDISLSLTGVTDASPVHTGPAVFNLLTSPRLLDAVEAGRKLEE